MSPSQIQMTPSQIQEVCQTFKFMPLGNISFRPNYDYSKELSYKQNPLSEMEFLDEATKLNNAYMQGIQIDPKQRLLQRLALDEDIRAQREVPDLQTQRRGNLAQALYKQNVEQARVIRDLPITTETQTVKRETELNDARAALPIVQAQAKISPQIAEQ